MSSEPKQNAYIAVQGLSDKLQESPADARVSAR